jgi:5,10-methylenetetrahydrofolate reductase
MEDKSPIVEINVILEACPPTLEDRDKAFAVLRQSFACYSSFHAVSVPDLQDEGEFRRKRERVSNEEFAAWLRRLTKKPLSLYKVSKTCTREEFDAWLDQAQTLGCTDVFIVGGDASGKQYKSGALQVCEAATQAREKAFNCGFTFFSTQILYESEWMCCLLLDLVGSMEKEQLPKIFLTFSPLVTSEDIAFCKKTLGVFIPKDVERTLKGARSMREASISTLIGVWDRISSFAAQIGFPDEKLGVNVEYLDSRNPRAVDASFELAEEFGRIFRRKTKLVAKT